MLMPIVIVDFPFSPLPDFALLKKTIVRARKGGFEEGGKAC